MKRLSVLFVLVIAFGFIMLLLSSCEKEPDFSYVYVIEVIRQEIQSSKTGFIHSGPEQGTSMIM